MVRSLFYITSIVSIVATIACGLFLVPCWWLFWFIGPFVFIGLYDIFLSRHNILINYPVIGHLRYFFEFIRPEIQQYFVSTNLSGRPFNRETRSLVYQRSKNAEDNHPFGTEHDITAPGYSYAYHSMAPKQLDYHDLRINIGGPDCKQPYSASLLNISAMSYGALSRNAIRALNRGARLAKMYHNTGEGGLTDHHLSGGGDLVWQIGTGYFGCRTREGLFSEEKFKEKASHPQVKMIEIKISQGAKPSHGGVLPKEKITEEIAKIRGIPIDEDCLSPPAHSSFNSPHTLLDFIVQLRTLTEGKPIGIKLCIGHKKEFLGLVKAMLSRKIYPDFITVDGAEGGTGAAPLEFTNRLGMPADEAVAFVHNSLVGANLREHIVVIASGMVSSAFSMVKKIALGADALNVARSFMFSLGCIQALRCHENTCPTGVTSNKPSRYRAIHVQRKSNRVYNYHQNTLHAFSEMIGAMGMARPSDLKPEHIFYRVDAGSSETYADLYHALSPGALLSGDVPAYYADKWAEASEEAF